MSKKNTKRSAKAEGKVTFSKKVFAIVKLLFCKYKLPKR